MLLSLIVKSEGLAIELKHEMVIPAQFDAPKLLPLFGNFGVKLFLILKIENYGAVRFVFFAYLGDAATDVGFDDGEAVVEPGLDELSKLAI